MQIPRESKDFGRAGAMERLRPLFVVVLNPTGLAAKNLSAAGLTVVAATPLRQRPHAIPEGKGNLSTERPVELAPVGEKLLDDVRTVVMIVIVFRILAHSYSWHLETSSVSLHLLCTSLRGTSTDGINVGALSPPVGAE